MEKKWKTKFVEDSFDSSDCSVLESNLTNWYDDRFFVYADPDTNEGIIICADYTMKFNMDECVIDLIINGEEDSLIWEEIIDIVKVPARFVAFLNSDPETFLYRISSNTSDKKEFYYFESTDDESGELLPISIDKLSPLEAWKAENFDSLISSMYNIF